jgi:predicted nucleotidyltransferase
MAIFTPEERQETAVNVARQLIGDYRIEGVVMVGSMATEPDRWSDFDLGVVVADNEDHAAVAAEWVRRIYETLPVVHHFETAFSETLVFGFLLDSSLELDLAIEPAASFTIWGPAEALFDRSGVVKQALEKGASWDAGPPDWKRESGFAWHDVLHACTAVRRGRLWQALWYLERIRNRTLALAQERRGFYADFFDYADDLPDEQLAPLLQTLVASLDPSSLLRAVEVATEAFLDELRHGEPDLSVQLHDPLVDFVRAR